MSRNRRTQATPLQKQREQEEEIQRKALDRAADGEEPEGVRIEGESDVVDKLLQDLLSVKDLKDATAQQGRQIEALRKIVTDQNVKIRQQAEEITKLRNTEGVTQADVDGLGEMFAEIKFDRREGRKTVKIAGGRSHKFRVTSPTFREALLSFRNRPR